MALAKAEQDRLMKLLDLVNSMIELSTLMNVGGDQECRLSERPRKP